MNNRRKPQRYDFSFPVRLRLEGDQKPTWSNGQTRDMSYQAVFVRAYELFPIGSNLEMYFRLPTKLTQGATVFVHAFGRVTRVEDGKDLKEASGFVATIERYDITRSANRN